MGRIPGYKTPVNKAPKIPDPETHMWWFHPNRIGVQFAPDDFRAKVKEFDPNLDVTWHPLNSRWLVWMRKPSVQNKICWGWVLLFPVQDADGAYCPLDDRIFARLYEASADKWGNGKKYFDSIRLRWEREEAARKKASDQDLIDRAMPSFEHSQIQVSGFGPSSGSKFSTYHA